MNHPRRLPSLSALQAFEATARHLSVKRAAAELAVTPTAVSHQVRRLEIELRIRLFQRRPRQLIMTPEGQRLYPVLRDGLDAFAHALRALAAVGEPRTVTLSATTAFTARWLLPRIGRFQARWPDLALHLSASEDPVDLREHTVDAAIRYGRGPYPGMIVTPLLDDVFIPVCSRRLRVRRPEDLRRYSLIHFEWRREDRRTPTWRRWLARAGVSSVDPGRGLSFSDESHAIAAAIGGHGVALLSSALIQADLEQGTLVQPFGPSLPGYRHHLVCLKEARHSTGVEALRAWISDEIAAGRGTQPPAAARQAGTRAAT